MGARRTGDPSRIASLASRPGIDTRVWLHYAVVEDVGFDANEGVFADIRFLPDGRPDCAIVGACYAGNGFGMYAPLAVDDVVLVAVPAGDTDAGPVIIARLWNGTDKPPAEMAGTTAREGTPDPTSDLYVRVQPGQSLKVRASSGGGVDIKSEGSGRIVIEQSGSADIVLKVANGHLCYVGDEAGAEPIALGQTLKTFLDSLKTWIDSHTHLGGTGGGGLTGVPSPLLSPSVPDVRAAKGRVK